MTDLIDRQLAAYLERDLDAFLACYAPETTVTDFEGNVLMDLEAMRLMYGSLFRDSPNLTARIAKRIVLGDVVVDEEEIHGFNLPGYPTDMQAVVAYHVTGESIDRVTFLKIE